MKYTTKCKQIFCPYTPSTPGWGQRVKKNLNVVMLHIKLKGAVMFLSLNLRHMIFAKYVRYQTISHP